MLIVVDLLFCKKGDYCYTHHQMSYEVRCSGSDCRYAELALQVLNVMQLPSLKQNAVCSVESSSRYLLWLNVDFDLLRLAGVEANVFHYSAATFACEASLASENTLCGATCSVQHRATLLTRSH